MIDDTDKAADVIAALKHRGFQYIGRTVDGWLKLHGEMKGSTASHACELHLDPEFSEVPRVKVLELPKDMLGVTPHMGRDNYICYVAKGTVVLDIFDPVGQTLACLKRAEEVFDKIFKGELIEDLEEEFYAYWNGPLCLVDLQGDQLGKQATLTIKLDDELMTVVTDDKARTAGKLKALGWNAADYTVLTYRIRTRAKPKPHAATWPPATVKDILAWQGLLDPRCRKKIEERIEEGLTSVANGALILIESPMMMYGFMVLLDRNRSERSAHRSARSLMYALKVMPVSVTRIDDKYMAQRNIPSMQTLAGKHLVIVGCGTIGGFLAEMLVKAGAGTSGGQLTLVDFESLGPQNIGRHRLGFPSLFSNKATEMAGELTRLAPGADIRSLPVDIRLAQLEGKMDLLIDATGEESLGHWLCKRYLLNTQMLSVWIEGPGTAVRALLRKSNSGACYRCLFDANRKGLFPSVVGMLPTLMAGQGCEGLYVPFPATVSVQAASLAAEMVFAWCNGISSPALRTKLIDDSHRLATPDCNPPRTEGCAACPS